MISINTFVNENKGKRLGVSWNSALTGQCVSLVQQYIGQCLGQPMKARGNAKDWIWSYPNEGLGSVVSSPERGDIIVWDAPYGGGYGHIAVYLGDNQIFDQNNYYHDNGAAGVYNLFGTYKVLRPNVKAPEDPAPVVDPFPGVSDEELAARVWTGEFGNGDDRKNALGIRYDSVQALVEQGVGKPTPAPAPQPTGLQVGDSVKIIGTGNSTTYGNGRTAYGIGWTRQILEVKPGMACPYRVGNASGTTGWYSASSLQKL